MKNTKGQNKMLQKIGYPKYHSYEEYQKVLLSLKRKLTPSPTLNWFCINNNINLSDFADYLNYINEVVGDDDSRKYMLSYEREDLKNKGYQIHHIFPKSLGGIIVPLNCVALTRQEHITAHKKLATIIANHPKLGSLLKKHSVVHTYYN